MLSNYTYSKYAINKGSNDDIKLFSSYYFKLISKPTEIGAVSYWEFKNCVVELNSMYFNFSGSGPIPPEPINYWEEVYSYNKPFSEINNKYYFVVWRGNENLEWKICKFKNTEKIRLKGGFKLVLDYYGRVDDPNKINLVFDAEINNLRANDQIWTGNSINFKAAYRWDGAGEPNLPEIEPEIGSIIKWNLKNNNINNNNQIKVTVKNKDVSENPVYQLEANYFNWLSITNELETNNILSLIPTEIKLSDGEYGKYLTNLIVSNDKLEECLNYFSQWYRLLYFKAAWMNMTKNLVEDNIKITFN